MNEKEMIEQIKSLIDDRKSFITNNEDSEIFKKDAEALEKILDEYEMLKVELSGYRQAILQNKEMLGLKEYQQANLKAIRIIDKFKETYIICFDKPLWGFVKRLEKCLQGGEK